jgi:hypothetical protein
MAEQSMRQKTAKDTMTMSSNGRKYLPRWKLTCRRTATEKVA